MSKIWKATKGVEIGFLMCWGGITNTLNYIKFNKKRAFDVVVSALLLPTLISTIIIVWVLNFKLNPGPMFYVQKRMGKDIKPIYVFKLRSMSPTTQTTRNSTDPLELDRITPLGAILRKTRLDELPQILNVLRGEMSLIGPRPDAWEHALYFCEALDDYKKRHAVTPGISGLAQVRVGYAEDMDAVKEKVKADLEYIEHASFALDLRLVWETIRTVILCRGT
ncbi:Sugar transferase involved in LPS biosynthesis (colanic, teichoic acid) [Epibacterium ulvae]|uniref:Sugar transferase involved in LPS biosynthesis (Colanic, teichoic acid) n=1 Tax=Epibacterium ulvae TaxID=1156985 RepID=A0A1G5R1G2_9RHOB|nr:sugar transferase [Epibacterium ulvae]SCZ67640.1 Sugar transferase involved in LPS biosynthesis (colanic, teichoic acid) [Epibacterium ulvae]